ncbi:MAG: hypothetical protein WAU88_13385 [Candidatus Zixiibacteriota bacterium]
MKIRSLICRFTLLMLMSLVAVVPVVAAGTEDTVKAIPGIEIKTSVDKAEVYVGDLVKYQVTIVHDPAIKMIPPPLGANLGAFDVKDYQADVETKLPDGRIQNLTTFVLSTFTTGDYIIPGVPLIFILADSTRKVMFADPVPIKIKSLLENAGDSVDIKPLKAPHEFKRNLTPYFVIAGIFLLLIAAALLFLRLRKRAGLAEFVDNRPAWEIGFEKLALLREKRLLDQDKPKLYYIELTEIIRWFLGRVYGITVLDMTTDEFLEHFRQMDLPEDLYDRTTSFLRFGDLVKFAKQEVVRARADGDFDIAHGIIELVRVDQTARLAALAAQTPSQPVSEGQA